MPFLVTTKDVRKQPLGLAVLVVTGACILLSLSAHLSTFPGLHFDEAWFGLEALRIQSQGLTSAHGMRTYTGALYPWLLAEAFQVWPPGVLALRLPGALLNAGAFAVLLVAVERLGGRRSAALFALLFGSSLLFLWMSRVAWEVSALQPLLLATMLAALLGAGRRDRWTGPGVALFLMASNLGVFNHLIFAAIPTSFLAAALVAGAGRKDASTAALVWIGTLAVVSMLLVLLVKVMLPDAIFARWHALFVVAFLVWPVALARSARATPTALEGRLERANPRWFLVLLMLGVAAFAAVHGIAFLGTLANVLVMKRMDSWDPPLSGTLLGYAWGLTLLGAFATIARTTIQRVRQRGDLGVSDLVTLWALACLGALTVLISKQAIRYYILPNVLFLTALALSLPARRAIARPFAVAAVLAFLFVNGVAWRGILEDTNRRPLRFLVGTTHESSAHFLRLDPVVRELEARGACRTEAAKYIELPLEFYRATRPPACGNQDVYRARYCETCPPAYITLQPVERP